jgi:tetratricopeptide (TPR) repeat protein
VALNILSAYAHPVGLSREHLDEILSVVRRFDGAGAPLAQTLAAVAWELEITGRVDDARPLRHEYVRLVEATPDLGWLRPTAYFGLGNNLWAAARWSEAAAQFRAGLDIGEVQGNLAAMNILHASLASCLLELDRPGEALHHAQTAIQLTPRSGSARNLALRMATIAHWRLGDVPAALAIGHDLARSLRVLVDDDHAQSELALLLDAVPALRDGATLPGAGASGPGQEPPDGYSEPPISIATES